MSGAWRGKKPRIRLLRQRIQRELDIAEGQHGRWVLDGYGVRVWIPLRRVLAHVGLRQRAGDRWRAIPLLLPVLRAPDALVERERSRRVYRGRGIEIVVKRTNVSPRGWHFTTLWIKQGRA